MSPCIVTAEKNNKPTTTKTSDIAVFGYWIKSKNVYIGKKQKWKLKLLEGRKLDITSLLHLNLGD